MPIDALTAILLIVMGGLFGWLLGKLPEQWIYGIAAVALVLGIYVISRGSDG